MENKPTLVVALGGNALLKRRLADVVFRALRDGARA